MLGTKLRIEWVALELFEIVACGGPLLFEKCWWSNCLPRYLVHLSSLHLSTRKAPQGGRTRRRCTTKNSSALQQAVLFHYLWKPPAEALKWWSPIIKLFIGDELLLETLYNQFSSFQVLEDTTFMIDLTKFRWSGLDLDTGGLFCYQFQFPWIQVNYSI